MSMKRCYGWETDEIEVLEAQCPYCQVFVNSESCEFSAGDKITCESCEKKFLLGELKCG